MAAINNTATRRLKAIGLVVVGVSLAAAGIFVSDADDAPGAALVGILLMIGALVLALRTMRREI